MRSAQCAAIYSTAQAERPAYNRFNAEDIPRDWHITVQRIAGGGQHAASWTEITGRKGPQPGCASLISETMTRSP